MAAAIAPITNTEAAPAGANIAAKAYTNGENF